MDDKIILRMDGISKSFPGVKALDNACFDVKRGEVHIILGENGAGKSTLIKILSGAYTKDSGEIYLSGRKIDHATPREMQNLGISTIYQEFNLIRELNVAQNIFLGKEPHRRGILKKSELYSQTQRVLTDLGIQLDPYAQISELSVAQQQMVEVAKALANEAKIIIMDEPTAALTEVETENLFSMIRKVTGRGSAIVYISHRLEEFEHIGDRITIMRDGKTLCTLKNGEKTLNEMISLMVGREITDQYPPYLANPGEEVLRVEGLTTSKIKDISFTLHRGEILGFSGFVGSGRTEMARAIIGADKLLSGKILVDGKVVHIDSPKDAINLSIAYLPESRKDDGLVLALGVRENTTLASMDKYERCLVINKGKEIRDVESYRDSLQIKCVSIDQRVGNLSGGNQQKVVIARWLLSECKVLIFDEPTRGIDVGAKYEMYKLINELARQGTAIIIISSDLPEVMHLSTRVVVMRRGEMAGVLERSEVTQEKIMTIAALGAEQSAGQN